MKGILLVDKPSGMTSHDVVDHVRKAAGIRKVGHTGTLDPAATGLLILCLGAATRLSEHLTGLDKVYEGAMRLGIVTSSYDMDGTIEEEREVPPVSREELLRIFEGFTGEIEQVPPMVSAVKIGGERLYKKARKGEVVPREARKITVSRFELVDLSPPRISFSIACSRGTYVRSICHDVGQIVGCGGVLECLRRTWVGNHCVDNALSLEELENVEDVLRHLVPLEKALDLPEVVVRNASRKVVSSGGFLVRKDLMSDCPVQKGWIQLKGNSGELLALGQVEMGPLELCIHPRRVFSKS